MAGWWFQTFFIFPNVGNVIIPTDFHSMIFQRGRLNHQPDGVFHVSHWDAPVEISDHRGDAPCFCQWWRSWSLVTNKKTHQISDIFRYYCISSDIRYLISDIFRSDIRYLQILSHQISDIWYQISSDLLSDIFRYYIIRYQISDIRYLQIWYQISSDIISSDIRYQISSDLISDIFRYYIIRYQISSDIISSDIRHQISDIFRSDIR